LWVPRTKSGPGPPQGLPLRSCTRTFIYGNARILFLQNLTIEVSRKQKKGRLRIKRESAFLLFFVFHPALVAPRRVLDQLAILAVTELLVDVLRDRFCEISDRPVAHKEVGARDM
jgi:hypothetical protein